MKKLLLFYFLAAFAAFLILVWKGTSERTDFATTTINTLAIKKKLPTPKRKFSAKIPHYHLSRSVIRGVKKFAFFIGYPRSGHSIVAALMDAHPHAVISNGFSIFLHFDSLNKVQNSMWRMNLYEGLYSLNVRNAGNRAKDKKGYTLKVDGMWQGKYDRYIEVIGDKSGGATTLSFLVSKENFTKNYRKLESSVGVPLRIIHVLRNPFDMIATAAIIRNQGVDTLSRIKQDRSSEGNEHKFSGQNLVIDEKIKSLYRLFHGAKRAIEEVFGPEKVLEIHNSDLVADPRGTVSKIFEFLEVETTQQFLDACEAKVFKSVSRSRDMVAWTPEQIERVESWTKDFNSLKRYSFTSD